MLYPQKHEGNGNSKFSIAKYHVNLEDGYSAPLHASSGEKRSMLDSKAYICLASRGYQAALFALFYTEKA